MQFNRCSGCMQEITGYPCPHCGYDPGAYQQPDFALPCGHILHGRYIIGKILGRGGFGITYMGWDLVLQCRCAIKEYYPSGQAIRKCTMGMNLEWSQGTQAEELRRNGLDSFLREARKMYKVDHVPGVVRVRDTFVENETAYIIMDYVDGQTLKSRLERRGVLSWDEARGIFYPVISTMAQVHQAGLVHRDLSPDNLMLQSDGLVSILDLGAAKDLTAGSGASSMQVAKGGFSPIEQYTQRGGSGPWSDVYAIAATMYYSLTGVLPTAAMDRMDAMVNEQRDPLRWDLPQLKALPKPVQKALQKAMETPVQKRTQSMEELLSQLQAGDQKIKQPRPKREKPVKPPKEPKPPKAPKPEKVKQERPPKPERVKQEKPPKPEKIKKEKPPKPQRVKKEKPVREGKSKSTLAAVLAVVLLAGAVFALRPDPAEPAQLAATEATAATEQTVPTEPAETVHVHNWAPATVGRPARCEGCGLMTGTRLGKTFVCNEVDAAAILEDGTVHAKRLVGWGEGNQRRAEQASQWQDVGSLTIAHHEWDNSVFGLTKDGTVLAYYDDGPNWTDIAKLGGSSHLVGLRKDGTVVVLIDQWSDEAANTGSWKNIVDVDASDVHISIPLEKASMYDNDYTVGLQSDGTLVIASEKDLFPEAETWTDIVSLEADDALLLGIRADGTVVYTLAEEYVDEHNRYIMYEEELNLDPLADWTDIVQLESSWGWVVGLKADGTVVTNISEAEVSGWKDIVSIDFDGRSIYGLKSDGTVSVWHSGSWYDWIEEAGTETEGDPLSTFQNIKIPKAEPPTDVHVHTWEEATVGRPARCSECGLMTGTSLGLTFNECGAGIREDGTVAFGPYWGGIPQDASHYAQVERNVAQWEPVISIPSRQLYDFFGVTEDGRVLAGDWYWSNPFAEWRNVSKLVAHYGCAAAVLRDGSVVAGERNPSNGDKAYLNTEGWTRIVDVDTGWTQSGDYTVGLKADGTLVFAAEKDLFPGAKSWTEIVAVVSGGPVLFGLKADGTVVYEVVFYRDEESLTDHGYRYGPQVEDWTDIVQIRSYSSGVVGLKSDGTVVTTNPKADVSGWTDIVAVNAGYCVFGLRSDGTVLVWAPDEKITEPWTGVRLPGR